MIDKLKNQKGITLVSLIIYVIAMLSVVTIVGTITSYFYSNVNEQYSESKKEDNETTLNMYLTNDLKNKKMTIELTSNKSKMRLDYSDGTHIEYTITEYGIYRNKVKIYNITDESKMSFKLEEIKKDEIGINKKQEIQILKNDNIFKSYIVNVK